MKYIKIITLLLIFFPWFFPVPLSALDWNYNFSGSFLNYQLLPGVWNVNFNEGLGGNQLFVLGASTIYQTTGTFLMNYLHLPWWLVERLVWYFPFLILSFVASYVFYKRLLSSFLFLSNTYILMIVGGGQVAIGLAYSLIPLILHFFLEKKWIRAGLTAGILLAIDVRFFLLSYFVVGLYWLFTRKNFKAALLSFVLSLLLNTFWILPLLIFRVNPVASLGQEYSAGGILKFLSVADFSHSLSFLHPNWPENIFGKVYFLQPEFLIFPMLAFGALLFKKKDQKSRFNVLFFSSLALIGVFLAKGVNEPFGFLYEFLFLRFPGFVMFRDPTKWYVLIVLSYAFLIPFTLTAIAEKFAKIKPLIFSAFVVFCLMTIFVPRLKGLTKGTFAPQAVPKSYEQLKNLIDQKDFYRTAWIPSWQRFGFTNDLHPIISGREYFEGQTDKEILSSFDKTSVRDDLIRSAVKYVIVPFDVQQEIFLRDRKYEPIQYERAVNTLNKIPWLKKISCCGQIAVYELSGYYSHFWLVNDPQKKIFEQRLNTATYQIDLSSVSAGDQLVFAEKYDSLWRMEAGGQSLSPKEYLNKFNIFTLPKSGSYFVTIKYLPQHTTTMIFLIELGVSLILIFWYILKKSKRQQ